MCIKEPKINYNANKNLKISVKQIKLKSLLISAQDIYEVMWILSKYVSEENLRTHFIKGS